MIDATMSNDRLPIFIAIYYIQALHLRGVDRVLDTCLYITENKLTRAESSTSDCLYTRNPKRAIYTRACMTMTALYDHKQLHHIHSDTLHFDYFFFSIGVGLFLKFILAKIRAIHTPFFLKKIGFVD